MELEYSFAFGFWHAVIIWEVCVVYFEIKTKIGKFYLNVYQNYNEKYERFAESVFIYDITDIPETKIYFSKIVPVTMGNLVANL